MRRKEKYWVSFGDLVIEGNKKIKDGMGQWEKLKCGRGWLQDIWKVEEKK